MFALRGEGYENNNNGHKIRLHSPYLKERKKAKVHKQL